MEKVKLSTGSSDKLKGTWDIGTNLSFERDLSFGFSWPQRNYTCSFCRKEFKSAQALGGHMNVHRRDRAKQMTTQQRHYPSSPTTRENSLSSNPNPNPNPNPYPKHPPTVLLAKPAAAARFLPYNMNNNYQASNSLIITSFSNSHEHLDDDDLVSPQIRDIRKKLGMEANFNLYQVGEFKGFKKQENDDQYRVWKKREFLGLDLNLGTQTRDAKEDLDLELRLGSS